MIFLTIFIIYEIFKIKVESSLNKKIRPSKVIIVFFNIFASIFSMFLFGYASFSGLNFSYIIYIVAFIFAVLDMYNKNKKYKLYKEK